ncbi:hypothetical protein [Pendulispora albinea]|uniref:Uncharacterized protein n=1 Tax=Pendulispora albinea TaxID=2741071 RepID=A0ABZ2LVS8_9BACT
MGIYLWAGLFEPVMETGAVRALAATTILGNLLEEIRLRFGKYELLDHWKQGEFHHDIVVRVPDAQGVLPGPILVIATNCNGGVKEVLCFDTPPDRWALWHWRCPNIQDFSGALPPMLACVTTEHWFDPCDLLSNDARSELKAEYRRRQHGGGWEMSPPEPCAGNRRA